MVATTAMWLFTQAYKFCHIFVKFSVQCTEEIGQSDLNAKPTQIPWMLKCLFLCKPGKNASEENFKMYVLIEMIISNQRWKE